VNCVLSASVHKLPPSFITCPQSKPNFDECLVKAIESALVDLKPGYAPLEVNALDPLVITRLSIEQGEGPVSINLTFNDLHVEGVSAAKVKGPEVHVIEENWGRIKGSVPKLILTGQYEIGGKVLLLPITGKGPFKLVVDDVTANVRLNFKDLPSKNGKTFKEVKEFICKLDMKKLSIHLENLFNGDKALGENMNRFLNENSLELWKELQPAFEQAIGYALKDISNKLFSKVPIDDILPK